MMIFIRMPDTGERREHRDGKPDGRCGPGAPRHSDHPAHRLRPLLATPWVSVRDPRELARAGGDPASTALDPSRAQPRQTAAQSAA
ncbi:hypothetical protein LL06_14780 [Hoeflea sp. BAL378]|nr:hypothetical protein LL06_14780 [Hoeflea sp. BAL378]